MSDTDLDPRGFAIWLLLFPWLLLFRAWCIWLVWGWFIAPLGFPLVGLGHALGISSFAALFVRTDLRSDDESFGKKYVAGLLCTLFVLLTAWVASWWMP